MVVDIVLILILLGSLTIGYKRGFLRTLFQTVGYLAGGVLGLYLALKFSHQWNLDLKRVGLILGSIIFGGGIGSLLGRLLAKGLRATIIRGPLAFIDSVAGAALEVARTIVIAYLIATVVLWSPWESGKSAVSESKLFAKIEPLLPGVITQANTWVKNEFLNLRP
jgi:uncharacterized membrane protein required for colicin V production